jgi:hypothetical protein
MKRKGPLSCLLGVCMVCAVFWGWANHTLQISAVGPPGWSEPAATNGG